MKKRFSVPLGTSIFALGGWFNAVTAKVPDINTAEIQGVMLAPTETTSQGTPFEVVLDKTLTGDAQGEMYLAEVPDPVTVELDTEPEVIPTPLNESESELEISPVSPGPSQASVQIISPSQGTVLDSNSSAVVIEVPVGSRTTLSVNGSSVDPNQIGQLETNNSTGMVRQTWYGVIFGPGDNLLEATATLNGNTAASTAKVQSPGDVARLRLSTLETRVPADGRSPVTVQGTLLDKNGNRTNGSGQITLEATAGEFLGEDAGPGAPGFQVDAKDGEFTATLQSSLDSGLVQIRARLFDLEAYTQVQFEAALRPSLLTGVISLRVGADNTDYFSSYRDFLNPDRDSNTTFDLSGAAFATGKIGDWLLTAALNSDRPLNETCETCTNRLFRADQSSEKPYPTYGDNSTVRNLTPSQDSFFLRLERSPRLEGATDPDYIMWGDYSTAQEFATSSQEFSALSRQLQGAKLNYNLGDLQISALYSQGGEAFQRDTLIPDGSSGFYFLTQRLVVPGSEEVFFELEELERPGIVVWRDRLQRSLDYDIDYDRGTIIFTEPVRRTEVGDNGEILVRRIIATYQNESGEDNVLYGGRLRYHFNRTPNQASWIGATYFHEGQGERDFRLYGVDAQIHLGENYKFIGEYAQSQNSSSEMGAVSGAAYRFELDAKFADGFTGRAYYRRVDSSFANNATISFVPGQTRYGADLNAQLSPNTRLNIRYDHEKNQGASIRPIVTLGDLINAGQEGIPDGFVNNELTTISAGIAQRFGQSSLNVDLLFRDRTDYINPVNDGSSTQLRTNFTTPLNSRLNLRLLNQTTLSANSDAVFSDRSQIGLDWRIAEGIVLNLNQNWYHSGSLAGQSTTSVGLNGEYKPWHNTTLTARYDIERFDVGMRDSLAFGLKHNWAIFENFDLDLGYEKVVGNLFGQGDGAVGQGASLVTGVRGGDSLTIRGRYRGGDNFQAEAGYEFRNTSGSSTSNINALVQGKLSPSLTALANFDRRFAAGQATRGLPPTTNLRLGLAYRNPYTDKFNALLRYEYRKNPDTIPETLLIGQGQDVTEHLFAAEAIYAPNHRWEFYGKLGFRNSTLQLADNFEAASSATLAQLRATYLLNRNVDITGGIRWLNQHTAGYSEMGWLAEVGYYATSNLRLAVGYSSGQVNNDRDFSGSRSDGGFYAGVTLKLDSLFGGFGRQEPIAQRPEIRELRADIPRPETDLQATGPLRLDVSQAIAFNQGSTNVSLEGQRVLDSLVTVLGQYSDLKLDIQGYLPPLVELTADNLTAQRLQAARQYLLSRGVGGDRLMIRSLGSGSQTVPVTFTLSGSVGTFQAILTQLGGNPLIGNLIDQGLPQLASLTPVTQNASMPITEQFAPQPLTITTRLTVFDSDEISTIPEGRYRLGDRLNESRPNFTYIPEWIIGFAPLENPDALLLAEVIPVNPITEFAISLTPDRDSIAEISGDRLLVRELPDDPQPATQILGDRRLDEDPANLLSLAPQASTLSGREARRLEAALYFLLSEDLNRLDDLFQISGRQQRRELGQTIDLDRLWTTNSFLDE
ncbi:hypothetical protein NIES970_28240 (plasmid) [[Synechococcus] sp. NIES-970]|nr:hypothetical protein NIES970_28240 [[Synechococcus] sp. NIES-970]